MNIEAWIAIGIALWALKLTRDESRRNNTPILKIKKFASTFHHVESKPDYCSLSMDLENKGIALHDAACYLEFTTETFKGGVKIKFTRSGDGGAPFSFARGMIAKFRLQSTDMSSESIAVFKQLKDVRKQKARVCVYSQGYLVATFPVGRRAERMFVEPWGRFVAWANFRYCLTTRWHYRWLSSLPVGSRLEWNIQSFVRFLAELKGLNQT